jgi:hypothetical protein
MSEKYQTTCNCPICKLPMVACKGSRLDVTDGVTMWCETPHGDNPGQCSAQEVTGHAHNEKEAFEIIKHKYKPL